MGLRPAGDSIGLPSSRGLREWKDLIKAVANSASDTYTAISPNTLIVAISSLEASSVSRKEDTLGMFQSGLQMGFEYHSQFSSIFSYETERKTQKSGKLSQK